MHKNSQVSAWWRRSHFLDRERGNSLNENYSRARTRKIKVFGTWDGIRRWRRISSSPSRRKRVFAINSKKLLIKAFRSLLIVLIIAFDRPKQNILTSSSRNQKVYNCHKHCWNFNHDSQHSIRYWLWARKSPILRKSMEVEKRMGQQSYGLTKIR